MPARTLKVMISSTARDLPEHRVAATHATNAAGFAPGHGGAMVALVGGGRTGTRKEAQRCPRMR